MHHAEDAKTERQDAMTIVRNISDLRRKEQLKRRKKRNTTQNTTGAHTASSYTKIYVQGGRVTGDEARKNKRKRKKQ